MPTTGQATAQRNADATVGHDAASTREWLPDWLTRDAQGRLMADGLDVAELAGIHGTPLYLYSASEMQRVWDRFAQATQGRRARICYALKANPQLAIIDLFRQWGAGFDIVSIGELERVLAVGGDPSRVVFSGVGKSAQDMRRALQAGIGCFNVESEAELQLLASVSADMSVRAPVSLRVNPDVDAATHPYISTGLKENKFGIAHQRARALYRHAASTPSLEVVGIDCHIGSQITDTAPFMAALDRVLRLVDELRHDGIELRHIDLGGGLGIRYRDEVPPTPGQLMDTLFSRIDVWRGDRPIDIYFEFGRALVGNAGVLVTRTEFLKNNGERHFAIVDAAMTELIRPALYQAWHAIVPVQQRVGGASHRAGSADSTGDAIDARRFDIVGPVCESGDWLGKDRSLPGLAQGDLLAILSAGAYGSSLASNYNSRPRPCEILLVRTGDATATSPAVPLIVRQREDVKALFALERTVTQAIGPAGSDTRGERPPGRPVPSQRD